MMTSGALTLPAGVSMRKPAAHVGQPERRTVREQPSAAREQRVREPAHVGQRLHRAAATIDETAAVARGAGELRRLRHATAAPRMHRVAATARTRAACCCRGIVRGRRLDPAGARGVAGDLQPLDELEDHVRSVRDRVDQTLGERCAKELLERVRIVLDPGDHLAAVQPRGALADRRRSRAPPRRVRPQPGAAPRSDRCSRRRRPPPAWRAPRSMLRTADPAGPWRTTATAALRRASGFIDYRLFSIVRVADSTVAARRGSNRAAAARAHLSRTALLCQTRRKAAVSGSPEAQNAHYQRVRLGETDATRTTPDCSSAVPQRQRGDPGGARTFGGRAADG